MWEEDQGEYLPYGDERPAPRLRGRRLRTLLIESDAWHEEVAARERRSADWHVPVKWAGAGYDRIMNTGEAFWELTTAADLRTEGREMCHCVAGYARACADGKAVIMSYRSTLDADWMARLSIHLNPREKRLVEVRGHCNRLPTEAEWATLDRWAELAEIAIPKSLRPMRDQR